MRITDALLGEHGVFYAQFDHLEQSIEPDASVETIRLAASMLAAALAPHAHLEDELLFGPAVEAGAPGGPMSVMHDDHEVIEGMLLEARRSDEPERARALLMEAVRAAREHFLKEECIAFSLAEGALGETRLRALGARWAEARGVALESTHEGVAPR